MAFEFTPDQRAAIENRGGSLLVSAAAGSGKTRVLTERLVRYVTDPADPVDIDRFLVITYTRAAAAELRGRIMEALARAAAERPDDLRLRRQQTLCLSAHIGTIHAFCADVLRENCHHLGLSPAFTVLGEDRAETIRRGVLARVLDRRYARIESDDGFRLLADTVGAGRDDKRLESAVLELYDKLRSHPDPEKWAADQRAALHLEGVGDAGESVWGRELLRAAEAEAGFWCESFEAALAEIEADEKLKKAYGPAFAEDAEALRELRRALLLGWDRAREAFAALPFPRLGALRAYPEPDRPARLKALRDRCKKAMASLADRLGAPSAALLRDQRAAAPAMEALLDLTLEFDRAFSAEKRRRSAVDFSDLEHYAARLLTDRETGAPTWIAAELAGRFTEIMVDEYQDVNAVQERIFRAVSRQERNLFLVGDVKQSIYRFRLADPTLFLEKYQTFVPFDRAAEGEGRKILLRENFRSRRCVLDAANRVFSVLMSREIGELDYDDDASLRFGALDYPEGTDSPVEFDILDAGEGGEDAPDKAEREAKHVAARIAAMLREGTPVYSGGAARPCDPGDFVILMRAPGGKGAAFHRALAEAGIPVQSRQGSGFFKSLEVTVAVDLLALADNPHADVPLISALRSPVFGFDPDALSAIRAVKRDGNFYGALRAAAEAGDEKCTAFLALLDRWRALAPDLTPGALLWTIYSDTALPAVCSAMRDGETRRANLMLLLEYAERFSEGGGGSLFRFVTYLRRLAEQNREPERAPTGRAVQIMSIHKSKGLEFPFVFLCDLAHRFNRSDLQSPVLMHSALGVGPKLCDRERGIEYPTLARRAIAERLTTEMLSEELRVLYVAMTRARERLIMTCVWKNPDRALAKLGVGLTNPAPPALLRAAQSPSQWLAMASLIDGGETIAMQVISADAEPETPEAPDMPAETPAADGAAARIAEKLAFRYPYAASADLPSKLTATELKGADAPDAEGAPLLAPDADYEFRFPTPGEPAKLTPAERGTATHAFLQHLRFSETGSIAQLDAEKRRIAAAGLLTAEEAAAVDLPSVLRLFGSPLGRRLAAAADVRREFRFTLLEPAADYFPGAAADDRLLLQGVVDCFFVEDGGVTVLDYKTDRVTAAEAPQRAERYRGQLRAYARALERILGLPVRRCALWFLRPGVEIDVEPEKT